MRWLRSAKTSKLATSLQRLECSSEVGLLESTRAEVAQLVEQPIRNRQVIGSIPILGSILTFLILTTYESLNLSRIRF